MKKKIIDKFRIFGSIAAWIAAIIMWEYLGLVVGAFIALAIAPRGFYSA